MVVTVDLLNACSEQELPIREDFQRWTEAALAAWEIGGKALELCIRLVDEEESAHLNEHFRNRQGPTNILSFPVSATAPTALNALDGSTLNAPPEAEALFQAHDANPLGDLAICAPLVKREAAAQGKTLLAHWAHLTIHGVLHLLGCRHEDEVSAASMENLETQILAALGYANPYG